MSIKYPDKFYTWMEDYYIITKAYFFSRNVPDALKICLSSNSPLVAIDAMMGVLEWEIEPEVCFSAFLEGRYPYEMYINNALKNLWEEFLHPNRSLLEKPQEMRLSICKERC